MTSYRENLDTDLGPLQKLADQWRLTHKDISGLGKRVQGEMLTPLRDKGYWDGVAAPYAWRMIDDIQRQLEDATKVAAAVLGVLDDALGELKSVKTDLEAAVKRIGEQGLYIAGDGAVSTSVVDGVCKVVEKGSDDAKAIQAAQKEINDIVRRGITADQNLAFSLMSDIGLGQWFNGKPQHSNIDTTNTIGQEEYALLDRAMSGPVERQSVRSRLRLGQRRRLAPPGPSPRRRDDRAHQVEREHGAAPRRHPGPVERGGQQRRPRQVFHLRERQGRGPQEASVHRHSGDRHRGPGAPGRGLHGFVLRQLRREGPRS
ncbi:hypothetical protein [Streptomyces vinaceus]|uniref:hypothetical protein n=1 Tax=Streptomyces vinaceus TaxID=1960 RepID=UPI003815838C